MTLRLSLLVLSIMVLTATDQAKVVSKPVPYQSEGLKLEGYLAYDDAIKGKRPGVLVVHEWWGLNDSIRNRVDQLASMGYVAFALDLYGKGKTTIKMKEATKMLRMVQMNVYRWHQRALAGLEVLRGLPQVDPRRIAAIGYGWGGATLQQQLFKGADLKGVVLFESFKTPTTEQLQRIKAKILVLLGASDPYVDADKLKNYIAVMKNAGKDWQMNLYGGAKHGFTDPNAAQYNMAEFAYNQTADQRSWKQVESFLSELFQKK
jgi:dienelactone hydrolase